MCFILELTLILFFFGVKEIPKICLDPEAKPFSTPNFKVKGDKRKFTGLLKIIVFSSVVFEDSHRLVGTYNCRSIFCRLPKNIASI